MIEVLPRVEVLRCYFEEAFGPHLPAMALRWQDEGETEEERPWQLPDGVCIHGPPPGRFGITIRRTGPDGYVVRLLWNECFLSWRCLSRRELLTSDLLPLLRALGTDLWHLVDQPVPPDPLLPPPAA